MTTFAEFKNELLKQIGIGGENFRNTNEHHSLSDQVASINNYYKRLDKISTSYNAFKSISQRGIGFNGSISNVTTDVPTLTHGTARTITSNYTESNAQDAVNFVGSNSASKFTPWQSAALGWNATYGYLGAATNGFDAGEFCFGFTLTGTTVELLWRAGTGSETQWIWVDGKPISSDPVAPAGLSVGPGSLYATKLTFGTSTIRQIKIYMQYGALIDIRTPNATSNVAPLIDRGSGRLFVLGDSFLGGSNLINGMESWGRILGHATGMETFKGGQGGTGYTAPGQFGARALTDPSRLDPVIEVNPDLVIIFMGGNDGVGYSTIKSAASQVYSYLNNKIPSTPIILVGTYPNDNVGTLISTRAQSNKAIRDAGLAAPNVIGFIDPIGNAKTGTTPSAYANGVNYKPGDMYTFKGAIYRVTSAYTGNGTAIASADTLLTWLTGTGSSAGTTGDGNRDIFYSGDGAHGTALGASMHAQNIGAGTEFILRSSLAGSRFTDFPVN